MKIGQNIECQACGASSVIKHEKKSMLECRYCGAMMTFSESAKDHSTSHVQHKPAKLGFLLVMVPVLVIILMVIFWLVFQNIRKDKSMDSYEAEISEVAKTLIPNLNHARKALAALDHLVVQDIFLTETAFLADVVLPASAFPEKTGTFSNTDRRVQLGRKALEMPGEARQDLEIIADIAQRLGLDWNYTDVSEVYEEMRSVMPTINGITWERLVENDTVTYPCEDANDPGQPVVFTDGFPTLSGKAKLMPVDLVFADEHPDEQYPFVLITGRQLEHWHTGAMTRRASILDAIEPLPTISVNPDDLTKMGLKEGDEIKVESRRGNITAYAREMPGLRSGDIFIPFCFHEAAANLLTNEAIDPVGKIPEFKYCAVKISAAA